MEAIRSAKIWPLDGLSRVFPFDTPPRYRGLQGWDLNAARGEYVTFQIGIASHVSLADIRAEPTRLTCGREAIGSETFRVRWAGLIPVGADNFHAQGAERPEEFPAWYPDPLQEAPPWRSIKDPPPRSAGIHLTLRIPRDAVAGVYRGQVLVRHANRILERLPLRVTVWPFAIPRRPTFPVANWFQHDCLVKWHRCGHWTERHWRLLDLYAADMAEHRQNVIATAAIVGNFHNHDPLPLVEITRRLDGRYCFDMRRLDRWVKLFDRHGFKFFELWHLASAAKGDTACFSYTDERTGRTIHCDKVSVQSPRYQKIMSAFLMELDCWLDARSLSDRFLLHIFDEPEKKHWADYAALSSLARRYAPRLRHIDAISIAPGEFMKFAGHAAPEIVVPLSEHVDAALEASKAIAGGSREVWWYTCLAPIGLFANRFVSQPLICPRILYWQAFARGVRGYLHWGYNFWHRPDQDLSGRSGITCYADEYLLNPYREQPRWPVGDTCIVYPDPQWWLDRGPVSSLRYEAAREGLQDYELLKMLHELAAPSGASGKGGSRATAVARARRVLKRVRGPVAGSLTNYTRDARRLLSVRREIGECIAALV